MEQNNTPDTTGYEEKYSEDGFWDKIKQFAKKVGRDGVEKSLQLYYALDNPSISTKSKAIIYGALGYFISPIDLIPDITPIVGFSDDIAALATAVIMVSNYIDDEVKAKASDKVVEWFGR